MTSWDGFRMFLAVARTGRLSTAARQLGVEHTTVSRRVAALEDELGIPLFHRTAGGYRLTSQGERALAQAEAMERAALAIGARAREHSGAIAGRVRVALLDEVASHWLVPKLPAFRAKHPELEVQILVGTRQADLSRGEADLAIRTPRPRQQGLAAVNLGTTTSGLYASSALLRGRRLRVVGPDSVGGHPLLIFSSEFHALQAAPWFQPILAAARVALTTNSTHVLLSAARAGLGLAVLPRLVARPYDDLLSVSDELSRDDMWLVVHPDVRRDPKVRATADFLKSAARGASGLC